jgi:hypothetical protein
MDITNIAPNTNTANAIYLKICWVTGSIPIYLHRVC